MRKRLIYSLSILFLLFTAGIALSMLYIYKITANLESVINLHRVEIIRQNLVINTQTVQSNLYAEGTAFGKEVDVIVNNVTALDNSVHTCSACHHNKQMTARLKDLGDTVEQYKDAISYLLTTTANPERIKRLKTVAVDIGDSLLSKTQEMAFIADKSLNAKTIQAIRDINNSRVILIVTLILAFIIALTTAVTLTRQITRPVYELVNAARMIASGNLGYQTSYKDKTEFGELASNFNAMSTALKDGHEKVLRYIRQLSGLYSITLSFYRITDMEDVYREICQQVADLLKVGQCGLILYDNERDMFIHQPSAFGLNNDEIGLLRFKRQRIENLFKFSNGLPIVSNNPANDDRFDPRIANALNERSLLIAWLYRKGKILGAIRAANKDREFTEEDARLLTILGNHMAVAIENAELYKNLQEQMIELRETQEQLVQSAKLAAIGELASNVAHEINNPLTSILGYTELIKDERDIDLIREDLSIIERESLRAREIVRQLLEFARRRPLQVTDVDINEVLKDVIPLVSNQARLNNVELFEEYEDLPKTIADSNQLKQVFINIINNAIFAMPEGGKLSIRTSRLGEYILVIFKDTGIGIPKEVIPKIFEPFFTTKQDVGTGLGLSISYSIIQNHGGRIDVESQEGKGSTFTVRLPIKGFS